MVSWTTGLLGLPIPKALQAVLDTRWQQPTKSTNNRDRGEKGILVRCTVYLREKQESGGSQQRSVHKSSEVRLHEVVVNQS